MIARCLAGTLAGFPLSGLLLALVLHWLPDHGQTWLIPVLLLFFPLWAGVMIGSYLFRNGTRAWLTLGAANALIFALLWLSRHLAAG
ncbi:hypothetical protein SAMN05216570_3987 [Dyella sp. OK004]|uniref:hypothetical protein n=1 Tax=Dyella sp. OK004 TaxID=1855292 RepID=UPI0008ED3335|nr:hypothetical protein [Dyella sp. OK004]SFS19332.1 hypothetical protein SAMN05216570_3987 [Dyella sp. OK004]